ncbi:MAG: signal peptidase II [Candidatus Omnitrophica bacterium]|nr:signal peptidase II [Candidatus Omnitrophota bacterium]
MAWAVAAAVFITDFFLKSYLRANFAYQSLPVLPNVFHITVTFNTGAAFGILRDYTHFLIYAGIFFLAVFFYFIRQEKVKSLLFFAACGAILGGALSNLADRIVFGYVIDYLDFRIWPVFNLSDACISIGAGVLIFLQIRQSRQKHHEQPDHSRSS